MSEESNPTNTIKSFLSHTIELNTNNWEFTVTGPEFSDDKYKITFASYKAARDEIQKRVDETNRVQAKNTSFQLVVLDANGDRRVIDRVNRATGEANGVVTSEFYPHVDWIRNSLQRKKLIQSELRDINDGLYPFHLNKSVGFYGRIAAERYVPIVEGLKKEFGEKTRLAEEKAKPQEVEKVERFPILNA
jgi:hypothetical protein